MPQFLHEGFDFHYLDRGAGVPFVFQHGLGGSTDQVADLFPVMENSRLICLDCRNHGRTQPSCAGGQLGFSLFARDVLALLDHLHIGRAHFGGIAMGAGVSIRIALDKPDRVSGLLLVRPAWLDCPMPAHAWFTIAARLIKKQGPQAGRNELAASRAFLELEKLSPDVAESLLRQFDAPQAAERVSRLETMPMDYPAADVVKLNRLSIPAQVIATDRDPIHPLDLAERIANELPHASFQVVTAKSTNLAMHTEELRSAIADWVKLYGSL